MPLLSLLLGISQSVKHFPSLVLKPVERSCTYHSENRTVFQKAGVCAGPRVEQNKSSADGKETRRSLMDMGLFGKHFPLPLFNVPVTEEGQESHQTFCNIWY